MTWFPIIVVAFVSHTNIALILGNPIKTFDDNFNVFLVNALEKYPAWIRDNNLDPSPPVLESDKLRINTDNFQLNVTISNEQIVGYLNQSNLFEITEVTTLVPIKWIILGFDYKGVVTFQGSYNATGTIVGADVPLNGNGSWNYTSKLGIHEGANIIFDVDDDGYVTIWDDYYLHNVYPLDGSKDEIYFEGLLDSGAGGYAEEIRNSLLKAYRSRLGDTETRDPTRLLLFNYLREVFKETPLEDIIGSGSSRM